MSADEALTSECVRIAYISEASGDETELNLLKIGDHFAWFVVTGTGMESCEVSALTLDAAIEAGHQSWGCEFGFRILNQS